MRIDTSTILIVNDVETMIQELVQSLPIHDTRVIKNEEEGKSDFLIAHSKLAIKEAYIAVNRTKYILLGGDRFLPEAQNSLLKVLEEPPSDIIFILITTSKTAILPTILSRMPHKYLKTKVAIKRCDLNLKHLSLQEVYTFLKAHQRIGKVEAKELIESIMYKVQEDKRRLTSKELESFTTAIKLCHLNSRPINIITTLLLNLIHKR
ncbi:MAG: DNA polymerase III subunit delta' [Arcobacteraceae bacterium]|nr:DNA polymerase III subunit delta' [Arcobacteraceae bacterium]